MQKELTPSKNVSMQSTLERFNIDIEENEELRLLFYGSRQEIEQAQLQQNDSALFGAVPHIEDREDILTHLPDKLSFFEQRVDVSALPDWKKRFYIQGLILYEVKFGESLSALVEQVLAHYPEQSDRKGRKISLFGLSGAGKSMFVDALGDIEGADSFVFIDSDTVRYNLLANKLKDVDGAEGATIAELRKRIHNRISGALYFALEYIASELRDRGYDVVMSSTSPAEDSDVNLYLEHPDVDPRELYGPSGDQYDEALAKQVAERLYRVTKERVPQKDNYDWEHAKTITDFRDMQSVSVQVPRKIHQRFLQNVGEYLLTHKDIHMLKNPREADEQRRRAQLYQQLEHILAE